MSAAAISRRAILNSSHVESAAGERHLVERGDGRLLCRRVCKLHKAKAPLAAVGINGHRCVERIAMRFHELL